jgi:hypothetical protein
VTPSKIYEKIAPQVGGNSMRCSEVYEWKGIFKGEQMDIDGTVLSGTGPNNGKIKQEANQQGQNKQTHLTPMKFQIFWAVKTMY